MPAIAAKKKAIKKPAAPKYQIKILDIPNESLIPNQKAFNPGIIDQGGIATMLYRYEPPYGDWNTEIACVELGQDLMPRKQTNGKISIIRHSSKVTTFDDPRPFSFNDEIYFTFSHGMVMPKIDHDGWCCSIGIAKMDPNNRMNIPVIPKYGKNVNASNTGASNDLSQEKNWMPVVHHGKLYFIYNLNPYTVIECDIKTGDCKEVFSPINFDLSFWKQGNFFGGGTQLIQYKDMYYGFFHTFTVERPNTPSARTYHVGAFSVDMNLKLKGISPKPIMTAEWDNSQDLRDLKSWWRPNVVFPCGVIIREFDRVPNFVMSYGWQDCRCKLACMPIQMVIDGLIEPKQKKV